ncbi:hypothetical protein NF700_17825 (plasmid) [Sphingomonadaceae bacterium OTU29MARTA1]|nr:hypothetical protein NF700_17825 [Sphingomonadaceae bacterium OTU29MARTA1]
MSAVLSRPEATPDERQRSEAVAELALRQDSTAVAAAATLGVNADLRGERSVARSFFAYAYKLSRRDLRTQLWVIEDAVGRGSISEVLNHYDTTLRVFPNIDKILYPILANASANPAIRSVLIRKLYSKPVWSDSFIYYVAGNSPDLQSTALLFNRLRQVGVAVPESAQTRLVDALLTAGRMDAAWNYYATIRSSADRRQSRDPRFVGGIDEPSQLDWIAVNDGGLTASLANGLFDFAAPASVGGPLLRQGQLLPSGVYRLNGRSIGIDQADSALPYWTLRCSNGRELGRIGMPNSVQANGTFSGKFVVPADCPMQTLLLVAQPSDAISGLSGQIIRVSLTPEQ